MQRHSYFLLFEKGSNGAHSYIVMNSPADYVLKVKAKGNEEWRINWMPRQVREDLSDSEVTKVFESDLTIRVLRMEASK